ncbi:MAG: methyltransferase domain-containing protein [Chloroflexi bacterium]|nr:methyltransferase domain-containing protein [Chloroflexota bacterium]
MTLTIDKAVPGTVNPGRILDISWGIARTGTLTAALDLDVFTHVASGASTARDVAARCDSNVAATATLLTCLASLGLLQTAEEGLEVSYSLSPDAEVFLVRGSSRYLGDMRHMHQVLSFPLWPRLAETVIAGAPAYDSFGDERNDVWTKVTPYLDQLAGLNTEWLSTALVGILPAAPRILDLGCGSGGYSRLLARSSPDVHVTAVDRDEVIAMALRRAAEAGLGGQIEGRVGDMRTVAWGGPYDLILFSNVLHGFDEAEAVKLLRRATSALAPEGRVAVFEVVLDAERPMDNPMAAFFSLQMLMNNGGRAHTLEDYRAQLRLAGFGSPTVSRSPAGPNTLLTAEPLPVAAGI